MAEPDFNPQLIYAKPIRLLQCLSPHEVMRLQRMATSGLLGGSAELDVFLKKLRTYGPYLYRHADLSKAHLSHTFKEEAARHKDWLKYRLRELQKLIENYLLWQSATETPALRAFLLATEYLLRNQPDGYEEARLALAQKVAPPLTNGLHYFLQYQLHLLQRSQPGHPKKGHLGTFEESTQLLHRFYLGQLLHMGIEERNRATLHQGHSAPLIDAQIEAVLASPVFQPLTQQPVLRQMLALYHLYNPTLGNAEMAELLPLHWSAFEPLAELCDVPVANYLLNLLVKLNNRGMVQARGLFEVLVRAMYQNGLFNTPGSMTPKRYRSIVHIALENGQLHLAKQMNDLLHLKVPGPEGEIAWRLNAAAILYEENRPAACLNQLAEMQKPMAEAEHLFMLRLRIKACYTLCEQRMEETNSKLWDQYDSNLKNAVRNLEIYLKRNHKAMAPSIHEAHLLFCGAMRQLMGLKHLPELQTRLQQHHLVAGRLWLLQQVEKAMA